MKQIILLFTLLVAFDCFSQNTVKITHTNFTTTFDTLKKYPVVVEWWSTKKIIGCDKPLKRKDAFKSDPKLPKHTEIGQDYVGSGFDRGHMMPAADNLCQTSEIQEECFYFSNISAQYHRLNAGDWKSLETFVRNETSKLDSIKVWAGNLGEIKKIGRVSVPEYSWKVIYVKKDNKFRAFLFKNDLSTPNGFLDNEVTIDEIKKITKLKFAK